MSFTHYAPPALKPKFFRIPVLLSMTSLIAATLFGSGVVYASSEPAEQGCWLYMENTDVTVQRGLHYYDPAGLFHKTGWLEPNQKLKVCAQAAEDQPRQAAVVCHACAGTGTYEYNIPANQSFKIACRGWTCGATNQDWKAGPSTCEPCASYAEEDY